MADTFNNDLRVREQEAGSNSGTWGGLLNTTISNLASAFGQGSEAIPNASTHTITLADGVADEARSLYLKCTGGGQACTVTLAPNDISKVWIIDNETAHTLTFKQGNNSSQLGTEVAIGAGAVKMIVTNGAGVNSVVTDALSGLEGVFGTVTATGLTVATSTDPASITLRQTGNTSGFILKNFDDDEAQLVNVDNGPMVFKTNDTERLRISSTGAVSIGSSSATARLEVTGAFTFGSGANSLATTVSKAAARIRGSSDATTSLFFGSITNDAEQYIQSTNHNGSAADDIALNPFGGNVGVGVAPSFPLHVQASDGGLAAFSNGVDADCVIRTASGVTLISPSTGTLALGTSTTERMRIDQAGKIGIGGASTGYKVHVFGDESMIRMQNTGSGTNGFLDLSVSSTAATINANYSTSAIPLKFITGATERMRLTTGGSFQVKGSDTNYISNSEYHQFAANIASIAMYVQNSNTANGSSGILINVGNELGNANGYFIRGYSGSAARDNIYIYSNGDVSNRNGTYSQFSDVKLKQDIADANNQWQDFKSIQFRKYRFKDDVIADPNAPYQLGVVAQELEAAGLNGLVTESPDSEFYESPVTDDNGNAVLDEDGNAVTEQQERLTGETTKSVKMSILYAKGMVALQEAMARIETLEAKVQTLEKK